MIYWLMVKYGKPILEHRLKMNGGFIYMKQLNVFFVLCYYSSTALVGCNKGDSPASSRGEKAGKGEMLSISVLAAL